MPHFLKARITRLASSVQSSTSNITFSVTETSIWPPPGPFVINGDAPGLEKVNKNIGWGELYFLSAAGDILGPARHRCLRERRQLQQLDVGIWMLVLGASPRS